MNSYHYDSTPPKGYTPYYDSNSPYDSDYVYYAPQYETTPLKRHSRKGSYVATATRPGGWHSPAGYPSPNFYQKHYDFESPPVTKDVYYVSPKRKGLQTKSRSYSVSEKRPPVITTPRKPSQPIRVYDEVEDAEIIYREPSKPVKHTRKSSADQYFYFSQDQIHDEQAKRSRARRPSVSNKSPQKSPSSHVPPKATAADADRWNIPPGYSIKNWDPTEKPIVLLGSVFDANSLGKWIYDWTVYHHGASTPMADVAGDLWLLLIKLAGKMKRAEECVRRIRSLDAQEMVEDFIESGLRLWDKFKTLLKDCERYMWRAAKREGNKSVSMGKNAGTEFVDSIFGRDRELESTEKAMNSIRLWNMRFDANCEDILRRPSAA